MVAEMDKLKIADALKMHPFGHFTINTMQIEDWGRDLVFDCVYDPGAPGKPTPFQLQICECREIRWRVYIHARNGETLPAAHIVNFNLGTHQHRKPLNLLTDHFGLTALYDEVMIRNGGDPVVL